jgi:hypothetical protein
MWDVPNVNNPAAAPLLITGANGAICDAPTNVTCYAPELAIVNYIVEQFSSKD